MTTSSITFPAALAAALSLPDVSLADGTAAVETVSVAAIGGGLLRRAIRMSLPLDRESAATAHRTERLSRIREHVIRPARVLTVLALLTGAVVVFAMDDPPRTLTMWTVLAFLVVALAEWALQELINRSALLQHPRRAKNNTIRLAYVPEPVAQELVRRNPGATLSR